MYFRSRITESSSQPSTGVVIFDSDKRSRNRTSGLTSPVRLIAHLKAVGGVKARYSYRMSERVAARGSRVQKTRPSSVIVKLL